ncbi:conserved membrane hypothetical protein [Burkholderiales bacterium]|nr:conserved membrane hypothetical protein [Burkholderiales bacterium]
MLLNAVSLLCALLIGFAAHRASLCNVRAVAEILTAGTAHMLWSLLQAVLWMATLTGALVVLLDIEPPMALARAPLAWALAGGLLFGIGAAINDGCSISTLHRLADGELGMLASLAGFAAGVCSWFTLEALGWPMTVVPVVSPWRRWPGPAPGLLALLLLWALLRLRFFWQLARHAGNAPVHERLLAPNYHLSVSAALLGIAGGLLFAITGAWSYSNFLRSSVLHQLGDAMAPSLWHGVLIGALLVGMIVSAVQRRSHAWRWPATGAGWLRHAGGGALMGTGAAMIPGGNDTLLLNGLPALSAAATGAYVFMLAGIASVLFLRR